jgi:hypothetical protein
MIQICRRAIVLVGVRELQIALKGYTTPSTCLIDSFRVVTKSVEMEEVLDE